MALKNNPASADKSQEEVKPKESEPPTKASSTSGVVVKNKNKSKIK